MKRLVITFLAFLPLAPALSGAQGMDHSHMPGMDHAMHMQQAGTSTAAPTEPGQSAFAAIQEIVELLESDPGTDWSKVDIEALRRHLIDMDNVTLRAEVHSRDIRNGARFTVTGAGPVRESIRRMVPAHAATMNGVDGWAFMAGDHPAGATLTVTANAPKDVAKIRALGFIGVMTRGMHHQAHHLMIATGHNPHH